MEVLGNVIDFGQVYVSTHKDTIHAVIKNICSSSIDISDVKLLGPDDYQFKILQEFNSNTIAPNEEKELTLQFTPEFFGRTCCDIGIFHNGVGSPARTQLYGEGIGIPTIAWLPDTTAKVGTKNYIIQLKAKFLYDTCMADMGFNAEIRFNYFAFLPIGQYIDSEIVNGDRVIRISGNKWYGFVSVNHHQTTS